MHYKRSANAKKSINEKLSVQTKLPFKHSKQVYTCSHCLVCICGEVTYKKHMDNCSKYKCAICKKTFFSDRTFQKHKHNCPPKRYPCPICKKDYSRKSDTDKHMKTHVRIRETFTCHWCGCQCLTGKQLNLHIEQKHGDRLLYTLCLGHRGLLVVYVFSFRTFYQTLPEWFPLCKVQAGHRLQVRHKTQCL